VVEATGVVAAAPAVVAFFTTGGVEYMGEKENMLIHTTTKSRQNKLNHEKTIQYIYNYYDFCYA